MIPTPKWRTMWMIFFFTSNMLINNVILAELERSSDSTSSALSSAVQNDDEDYRMTDMTPEICPKLGLGERCTARQDQNQPCREQQSNVATAGQHQFFELCYIETEGAGLVFHAIPENATGISISVSGYNVRGMSCLLVTFGGSVLAENSSSTSCILWSTLFGGPPEVEGIYTVKTTLSLSDTTTWRNKQRLTIRGCWQDYSLPGCQDVYFSEYRPTIINHNNQTVEVRWTEGRPNTEAKYTIFLERKDGTQWKFSGHRKDVKLSTKTMKTRPQPRVLFNCVAPGKYRAKVKPLIGPGKDDQIIKSDESVVVTAYDVCDRHDVRCRKNNVCRNTGVNCTYECVCNRCFQGPNCEQKIDTEDCAKNSQVEDFKTYMIVLFVLIISCLIPASCLVYKILKRKRTSSVSFETDHISYGLRSESNFPDKRELHYPFVLSDKTISELAEYNAIQRHHLLHHCDNHQEADSLGSNQVPDLTTDDLKSSDKVSGILV